VADLPRSSASELLGEPPSGNDRGGTVHLVEPKLAWLPFV
jgi:hypothetical protein